MASVGESIDGGALAIKVCGGLNIDEFRGIAEGDTARVEDDGANFDSPVGDAEGNLIGGVWSARFGSTIRKTEPLPTSDSK